MAVLPVVMSNQGGGFFRLGGVPFRPLEPSLWLWFLLGFLGDFKLKNTIDKLEKGNIIKLLALLLSEC